MSRRQSLCLVSIGFMLFFAHLLALRHDRQIQLQRQQLFGHYSERDVMRMATPIIEAILPTRKDLFLTAEQGEVGSANDRLQRVWNIDCLDGQGNTLIHMTRDAENGRVCGIWRKFYPDLTALRPAVLSPRMAEAEARRWLSTLGDREAWIMKDVPQRHLEHPPTNSRSFVTLERPGWRAHVSLDDRSGSLIFADIIPTR